MESQRRSTLKWLLTAALALGASAGYVAVDARAPFSTPSPFATLELKAQTRSLTSPILPLSADAKGQAPFFAAALRDADLAQRRPEDEEGATRLAQELKEIRGDLSRSQGGRALELSEQAVENATVLAYYFEDVLSGRLEGDRSKARANFDAMRNVAVTHANALQKLTNDEGVRAKARYHALSLDFAAGKNRGATAAAMAKLADGKLPAAMKSRARLALVLVEVDAGSKKALKEVAGLAKGLSAEAQIGVRLTAARAAARAHDASYRTHLSAAVAKSAGLSEAAKTSVLKFSLGVWQTAEAGRFAWDKAPFSLKAFSDTVAAQAISERIALAAWAKGDRAGSIKRYENLASAFAGRGEKAELDLRALDLRRADGNVRGYEQALIRAEKSYLDPQALGEGKEAQVKVVAAEISRRHGELVMGEIARASSPSVSKAERSTAIAMADAYVLSIDDAAKQENVRAKVGSLYALNGQHREAVALFKELAEESKTNAKHYLASAVDSQSILASWPKEAPWGGYKAGDENERSQLLDLYVKLGAEGGKKASWPMLAQTGLLQVSLNQVDLAFKGWTVALKVDGQGTHAANAAGWMLTAYEKAGEWAALESVSRIVLKREVAAVFKGSRVDAMQLLGLALLEGGKDAMDEAKFKVAVAKLKEFVKDHAASKRHDEGFFLLASAFRGDGQHKSSIETLISFTERYPSSKFYRQALLNGGDWSAPMAYEENAIFFWQRFVNNFNADSEAGRVRDGLTSLYLGRGLYAEAISTLDQTVKSPSAGAEKKADALVSIMQLEERHGAVARAERAADLLIKASDAPEAAKAQAFGVKARAFAKAGKAVELKQLEAQVQGIGSGSIESQETLGEIRFYIASAASYTVLKKFFNLALKDPNETIEKRYAAFNGARTAFNAVCDAGQSSFCAPAMHRLARLAEEFSKSLDDVEIQEQLAKNVVDKFKARKQHVQNEATRVVQIADSKAVSTVKQGFTDPEWTQAVLWQNASDWNFERVSGEAGNGFVQWTTR